MTASSESFADRQSAWARRLLGGLVSAGVREVVVSPGSRSSPLVLAALDLAEARRIRLHTIVDERSAAFFALGCARTTAMPAALISTSGSAGAHYLPALVEARHAFVPLIALTADRPLELLHCGANQAIDQTKLFGDQVVASFEIGLADGNPAAQRRVDRMAAQAVATSRWPMPGGVHLNVRFRKPLEPSTDAAPHPSPLPGEREPESPTRASVPRFVPPRIEADEAVVDEVFEALRSARSPLIVCGPMPIAPAPLNTRPQETAPVLPLNPLPSGRGQGEGAFDCNALDPLAIATGAAVYTEPTSQLRFASRDARALRLDALGVHFAAQADLILSLGAPPTTTAWGRAIRSATIGGARHVAVAPHGWPDPDATVDTHVTADPGHMIAALASRLTSTPGDAARLDAWRRAESAIWVDIAQRADGRIDLSEAAVLRSAAGALQAGDLLAIGNSLPVRLLDAFVPADRVADGVSVLHQRGASGIDGLVSGAAGAATASGRRTLLVLGDVSLLHDLGGLAVARDVPVPLVIVVIDNGGGRIFDLLPIADHPATQGRFEPWHTPPRIDFASAAATFGMRFDSVPDVPELDAALRTALETSGATLIHATTPPGGARDDLRALARAADHAARAVEDA